MRSGTRLVLAWIAAVFFTAAGFFHFVRPAAYLKIIPPHVPWHSAMVFVSGAGEMAGGIGLTIPMLRRAANVYMAMAHIQITARPLPGALLWGRLLLQPLLIWWVLWCTAPPA